MQKQRSLGKRSRRPRHEAPKVWFNPDVVTTPGASRQASSKQDASRQASSKQDASRQDPSKQDASKHGSPRDGAPRESTSDGHVTRRSAGHPSHRGDAGASLASAKTERAPARAQRIVAAATGSSDPQTLERDRLIARLVVAEGRPAITRAADAILAAGFQLPVDDQSVQLQLLEHSKEDHVEAALEHLARILAAEPCKRQTVLESRLRRLEQFADEPTTRDAARRLWRQVTGRAADPPRGPASRPGNDSPATLRSLTVDGDARGSENE